MLGPDPRLSQRRSAETLAGSLASKGSASSLGSSVDQQSTLVLEEKPLPPEMEMPPAQGEKAFVPEAAEMPSPVVDSCPSVAAAETSLSEAAASADGSSDLRREQLQVRAEEKKQKELEDEARKEAKKAAKESADKGENLPKEAKAKGRPRKTEDGGKPATPKRRRKKDKTSPSKSPAAVKKDKAQVKKKAKARWQKRMLWTLLPGSAAEVSNRKTLKLLPLVSVSRLPALLLPRGNPDESTDLKTTRWMTMS